MNRRALLVGCVCTSLIGSGCLSRGGNEEVSTGESEVPESTDDKAHGHDPSPSHILQVSVVGSTPDDNQVVDPKEAGITENEPIATALEKASDEYTDGMEDDLGKNESRILASISDDGLDGAEDKIESGTLFVDYEGVTYLLMVAKMSLETK
ncbi:hypothetical protein [Halostagnicola kamekurae]|nr:hypothetical protein [Halostagnicola kamekurae]